MMMIASDKLDEYLALFSPVHQEKPRLMALASAVLSQAGNLFSLYGATLPAAFSPEIAEGAQLDAISSLLDLPRPAPDTSDADQRTYLRARIQARRWDGANGTLPALLGAAFPDQEVRLSDNQNGTLTVVCTEALPFPTESLLPKPAGIRMIR